MFSYFSRISPLGSNALRNIVVCIRVFKFTSTEFCMVALVTRLGWICHWMCTTIVSNLDFIVFSNLKLI